LGGYAHAAGKTRHDFHLEPGAKNFLEFPIEFDPQALAALYPVHVKAEFTIQGQKRTLHAVRIVETVFPHPRETRQTPERLEAQNVPEEGALAFCALQGQQRAGWNYFDGPTHLKPVGWSGDDEVSRANVNFTEMVRGSLKPAIGMHRPGREGAGRFSAIIWYVCLRHGRENRVRAFCLPMPFATPPRRKARATACCFASGWAIRRGRT
jgi:hypothetical protein